MALESPPLIPRELTPYEYLQFVQCASSPPEPQAAVTTRGLTTRIQAFHLYWKEPTPQQLADYDIELVRPSFPLPASARARALWPLSGIPARRRSPRR